VQFQCSFCGQRYISFGKLARHISTYHENVPRFSVDCVVAGCRNNYKSVSSLRKHMQRFHGDVMSFSAREAVEADDDDDDDGRGNTADVVEDKDDTDVESEPDSDVHDVTLENIADIVNQFHEKFTMLMLRLKEVHILPAAVQSDISTSVCDMMTDCLNKYKDIICQQLSKSGFVPCGDVWSEILSVDKLFESVSRDSSSDYMMTNYLKRSGMIVEPVGYVIPEIPGGTYQYVPILNVLEKLLTHSDVDQHLTEQASRHHVPQAVLQSLCEGDVYMKQNYFVENPDALAIHLYADEVELCNPLGAKRGKHKITAVYYILGNIHSKFRSQQHLIHLALLVKHKYVKECGYDYKAVMQPLLHDLNSLQLDGITVSVNGCKRLVKGKLIAVSADNLTAHALGGFQQFFHSGRICRHCMIHHADIASHLSSSSVVRRNADSYAYHLAAVSENTSNVKVYGVSRACVFSILPDFDLFTAFPPDIMHDVLEGVMPVTLKLVLKSLIDTGKCALSDVNAALTSVKLSHPENKPVQLSEMVLKSNGHIAGSAIQKLELFLLFARMVGMYVPEEDKVWQVYLNLREVCDLLLAPAVDRNSITHLEDLISTYLFSFVEVFGADFVIPKMHFMVHYPEFIRLLGPMRNYWCMRFEAKHQYFKKVATSINCFKDITKTLAKRHQMRQSYELSGSEVLMPADRALSRTVALKYGKLSEPIRESVSVAVQDDFDVAEVITSATKICVNNVVYKVACVYVLGTIEEEAVPVFVCIKHIFSIRGTWILCGHLLTPYSFSKHFHAYVVTEDSSWVSCRPGQLVDHTSHDSFDVEGQRYISMRYAVAQQ